MISGPHASNNLKECEAICCSQLNAVHNNNHLNPNRVGQQETGTNNCVRVCFEENQNSEKQLFGIYQIDEKRKTVSLISFSVENIASHLIEKHFWSCFAVFAISMKRNCNADSEPTI